MVSFNSPFDLSRFLGSFEELLSQGSSGLGKDVESFDSIKEKDCFSVELEQLIPKEILSWDDSHLRDEANIKFWNIFQTACNRSEDNLAYKPSLSVPTDPFLYQLYRLYLTGHFSLTSLINLVKLGALFHLTLADSKDHHTLFTYDHTKHCLSIHLSTSQSAYKLFCSNGSLFDVDVDFNALFIAFERTLLTHRQLAQSCLTWLVPRFVSYQEKATTELLQHTSVEKISQQIFNNFKCYHPLQVFFGSYLLLFIIRSHPQALTLASFDFSSLVYNGHSLSTSLPFLHTQVQSIKNYYENFYQTNRLKKNSSLYFGIKLLKRQIDHFLKQAVKSLEAKQPLSIEQKQEIINAYMEFNSHTSVSAIRKKLETSLVEDYHKAFKHFDKEELAFFCKHVCQLIELALDKGFFNNADLIYQAINPLMTHAFCYKESCVEKLILRVFTLSKQEKDQGTETLKFKEAFFKQYLHLLSSQEQKTIQLERLLTEPVDIEHLSSLKQFLADHASQMTSNELKQLLLAQFKNSAGHGTELMVLQVYFSLLKQKETFLSSITFIQEILFYWKRDTNKELKQCWEAIYLYLYPLHSTYGEIEAFINSFEQLFLSDTLIQHKFVKLIESEEFQKLKVFIANKKINGQRELAFYFEALKQLKEVRLKLKCFDHLLDLISVSRYTKAIKASLEESIVNSSSLIPSSDLQIYFSILKKILKLPSENPSLYCAQVDAFHALEKIFPVDLTASLTFNAVLIQVLSTLDWKTHKIGINVLAFYEKYIPHHPSLKETLPSFFKQVSSPIRDQLLFVRTLLLIYCESIPIELPNLKPALWESLTHFVIQHCPDQISTFLDFLREKKLLIPLMEQSTSFLIRIFSCSAFIEETINFIKWLTLYDLFGTVKDCPKNLAEEICSHLHKALLSFSINNADDFIALSQRVLKKIKADEYEFHQILSDYYRQKNDWEALYHLVANTAIDLTVFTDQELQWLIDYNFTKLATCSFQKLKLHVKTTKQLQIELLDRSELQLKFKALFQPVYYTVVSSIYSIDSKQTRHQNWKLLHTLASPLEMLKKAMDLVDTRQEASYTLSSVLQIAQLMIEFSDKEVIHLLQSPLYEQLFYFCELAEHPSLIYSLLSLMCVKSIRSSHADSKLSDLIDKRLIYQVYQRRLALDLSQIEERPARERAIIIQIDELLMEEAFLLQSGALTLLEGSILFFKTLKVLKDDLVLTSFDPPSKKNLRAILSQINVQNPDLTDALTKSNLLKNDETCSSLIENFLTQRLKNPIAHPLLDSQAWGFYSTLLTFPHKDFYPVTLRLLDLILNQERFVKNATFPEHFIEIAQNFVLQIQDFAYLKQTLFYFLDHPQLQDNHFNTLKMEIFYCTYSNARKLHERVSNSGQAPALLISTLFMETERRFIDLFQQTFSYIDETLVQVKEHKHTVLYQARPSHTFGRLTDLIGYLLCETFKECNAYSITDGYQLILAFFNAIVAHIKCLSSHTLQAEGYVTLIGLPLLFYRLDTSPVSYQLALRCFKVIENEFFADKERLALNIYQTKTRTILRDLIYEMAPRKGRFLTTQIYQQWFNLFEGWVTKALESKAIDKSHSIYQLFLLIKQDDHFDPSKLEVEDVKFFFNAVITTSSPVLKKLAVEWVHQLFLKVSITATAPENEQQAFTQLWQCITPYSFKHATKLPSVKEFKEMSLETLQKLKWVYVEFQSMCHSKPNLLLSQLSLVVIHSQLNFLNFLLYLQKEFFKANPEVNVSKNAISLTSWITHLLSVELHVKDRIFLMQIAIQWLNFCWENDCVWSKEALTSFEKAIQKIPEPFKLLLCSKTDSEKLWNYAKFIVNLHHSFFYAFKSYYESHLSSKLP